MDWTGLDWTGMGIEGDATVVGKGRQLPVDFKYCSPKLRARELTNWASRDDRRCNIRSVKIEKTVELRPLFVVNMFLVIDFPYNSADRWLSLFIIMMSHLVIFLLKIVINSARTLDESTKN